MLMTLNAAADYIGVSYNNLYVSKAYNAFIVTHDGVNKFDIDAYSRSAAKAYELEHFCIDRVNFAEFVIEMIGVESFYASVPQKHRQEIKRGLEKNRFSAMYAQVIDELFSKEWDESYNNWDEQDSCDLRRKAQYIPFDKREPLTQRYILSNYWHQRKTIEQMAEELNVPTQWVYKEIRRLGMGKNINGIKRKGRKGWVASQEYKDARKNQPQAKAVVQICPKTFTILNEYSSITAVEYGGYSRKGVSKAIKRAGLHKGYLWAEKGWEKPTIENAKKRGNLLKKLQISQYKKPTKKELQKYYIDHNMTAVDIAQMFHCHHVTIALLAGKYGLKKRMKQNKSKEQ